MKVKLAIAGAIAAFALLPATALGATHTRLTGTAGFDYANPCGGEDLVVNDQSALLEIDTANNDQTSVDLTIWGASNALSMRLNAEKDFRHSASSYTLPFTETISRYGHQFVKVTGTLTVNLLGGGAWSFATNGVHATCMDD